MLPGLDPCGKRPAQRPEPVAHEFPGCGMLLLQRIGGERGIQLHEAGDRAVPLSGLDYQADGGLVRRGRVPRRAGLVGPVRLNQQLVT